MHVLNYNKFIGTLINAVNCISYAYSCLPDEPFSESIEINEELLDSNSFLVDISLEPLLNIQLHI